MTTTTPSSALTPAQEQRLARHHIDPGHVWWWKPHPGIDYHWVRAWRGISFVGLPQPQPGLDPEHPDWDPDIPCTTIYAIGHNRHAGQLLDAVAAHASWEHPHPQQLRELGPGDLVEGWAEFLRHRRAGCTRPNNCPDEDGLYVFDADPGDYQAVPVTRISHPEGASR
ncbi:hypothetical protein [Streptomyces lasiicapitis]|uniref:hypothetical protein n=1 Tax=Streptomyces lasiicapitis TaxID=1923961 RepID=UPI003690CC6D